MKIFFSAGEPSGDLHGANLIRELRKRRPQIECVGFGGPKMHEVGCNLLADLTLLAVMWFFRAILNFHKFVHLLNRSDRYFERERPDAVVLIDYPGFNWWIARRAKRHGIPVFYYAPPQLWAWGGWRVKKVRRFVDHVLCSLPFETEWFRERGCRATFVGHPYFDEVRQQELDQAFIAEMRARPGPLVTILPGSRTQEVTSNLRWFLKAAESVRARVPRVRLAIAAFKPHHAEYAKNLAAQSGLAVDVFVGRTPELIHLADCCMACSGSVSLELLYHKKPTVILYWITRFAYRVQTYFRKVQYITLVNLLTAKELFPAKVTPYDPKEPGAERVLFPEYLTWEDKSLAIAGHVVRWLVDDNRREGVVAELAKLKARVAHGGASSTAAELILAELDRRSQTIPRPHFEPATAARAAA
jgi:lipid-A-disaccharide synthase